MFSVGARAVTRSESSIGSAGDARRMDLCGRLKRPIDELTWRGRRSGAVCQRCAKWFRLVRDDMPDVITSRDNKWLKQFRSALRGTGPRDGEAIGVEGPKLIEEALRSGLEAEALLVSEAGEREAGRILDAAGDSEAGIPRSRLLRTTNKLFEGVAGTETPQGGAG